MMQTIYDIAFLYLLKFDEILRIQYHHLRVLSKEENKIEIILSFRKTHQLKDMLNLSLKIYVQKNQLIKIISFLEIKSFVMYHDRENLHLNIAHLLFR